MSDLISRADAIDAVRQLRDTDGDVWGEALDTLTALPSAVAIDGDLISRADARKAFTRINDLRTLSLGKVGEVLDSLPSADAESKWNCTANFVAEQLERLKDMTDEERLKLLQTMFPSADAVHKPDYSYEADMVRRLKEAPSADAVHESCEDCPLYDTEKHSCPRFNKVIPRTIAEAVQGWNKGKPTEQGRYMVTLDSFGHKYINLFYYGKPLMPNRRVKGMCWYRSDDEWGDVVYDDKDILAWMPLPKPYKAESEE